MDDSDSSSLSEHSDKEIQNLAPVFLKAKAANKLRFPPPKASPARPKREPSPPHEEVLADNPDIAFIVMFRSRFNEVMPAKLSNLGPQDIERGVVDTTPSPEVSHLLCAMLGLALNRKKPPERGHHGRALEEAILSNRKDWPKAWNDTNPLHGGGSFENMSPVERLTLLRTIIMWALANSEAINAIIKEGYKQQRHNDDENQPLSVQPWGIDGDKRRYFLVQGLDDTSFRVYREGDRYKKTAHWWSVAGSIDEVKELAKKLEEVDTSQAARRLANKITNAIPTFEATEEKRRRREYRQVRRAAFTRPEPGFSLYEGRTRGKRMRYTFDDDDDAFLSDATSTRRSTRHSGRDTPVDAGPTVTASGRQVRQPRTGEYGESLLSGHPMNMDELAPEYGEGDRAGHRSRSGTEDSEQSIRGRGRPTRLAARPAVNGNTRPRKHIDTYNSIDEMSDEDEGEASGDEWDSDKNDDEDETMADADADADADDDMNEDVEDSEMDEVEPQSLVLKLKVPATAMSAIANGTSTPRTASPSTKATQAGASPNTTSQQDDTKARVNESHMEERPQQAFGSSPLGPSAYPTPTSFSFLPPDHKPAPTLAPDVPMSTAPAATTPVPARLLPSSDGTVFPNGTTEASHAPHTFGGEPQTTFLQDRDEESKLSVGFPL
ncbi:hypothetical protein BDY17DRAFT_264501 [Neohortaea acidophila]|uniref:WHIM1 domain-containing protein n=1 Tax=Neohortaea acidophila TaxID=245834 RepID=A0A6A6PWS7_9PEZI|nr:uncharacterized protein BDY17DRAFT_264501 [Neohortaea acidophila]KAF2484465.1 hypothetical protein BDY17DRAFT_264501 [Neohortaea acidophila]